MGWLPTLSAEFTDHLISKYDHQEAWSFLNAKNTFPDQQSQLKSESTA
jgi:hypothetical protein